MKKIFAIMACCAAATTMYASDVTESSYDVLNAPMETPSSASVPASSAAGATEDWKSQLAKMMNF